MTARAGTIDWLDIALHAGVAALLVGLAWLGWGVVIWMVLANVIFWPARELWQHRPDYLEILTHEQSLLEWLVPVCVCMITALLIMGAN